MPNKPTNIYDFLDNNMFEVILIVLIICVTLGNC